MLEHTARDERMDSDRRAEPVPDFPPVPAWRLVARLVTVLAVVIVRGVATVVALPAVAVGRGRVAARRYRYRRLVRLVQALGPTFVKFGQIAGSRRDALPPDLCAELSVLHDAVAPMSARARRTALHRAFGDRLATLFREVDEEPVASGSIAGVYRGRLPDGREVALKLKRPGIDQRMAADLALLRLGVRFGERLPKLRGMPLADLIGYISIAILGQLDFAKEARAARRLRETLGSVPRVRVPALLPDLSGTDCLVFEYVPGLRRETPETLAGDVRRTLAGTLLSAAHRMLFVDGFVHCDLHPGNVYLTVDEHVVVLDAGYSVVLPDRVRALIAEFFASMAAGHGRRCGEIVLESAARVDPRTDRDAFVAAVAALVDRAAGPGNRFDMPTFGEAMFDLQRDHGLYAASDFAFPLMSLMVLEGTVRGFCPDVDFQQVGVASGAAPAAVAAGTPATPASFAAHGVPAVP